MRKTNKYFRDMLRRDIYTASDIIVDVLNKYGKSKYSTFIRAQSDNKFWNCRITGIGLDKNNKPYLEIYWQGDSTDGYETIWLSELIRNQTVEIKSDCFDECGRLYVRHGVLTIKREWLQSVFNNVANYIEQFSRKYTIGVR